MNLKEYDGPINSASCSFFYLILRHRGNSGYLVRSQYEIGLG